jgi:hypothetical protein
VLAVALAAHAQIVDSSFAETSSPVDDIHDNFCCCRFVFEGLLFSSIRYIFISQLYCLPEKIF